MRCALVESSSGLVTNVIIADPATDPAPSGFLLIGLTDDSPVGIGWLWDGETFSSPVDLVRPDQPT
jgi:hypothetical protein